MFGCLMHRRFHSWWVYFYLIGFDSIKSLRRWFGTEWPKEVAFVKARWALIWFEFYQDLFVDWTLTLLTRLNHTRLKLIQVQSWNFELKLYVWRPQLVVPSSKSWRQMYCLCHHPKFCLNYEFLYRYPIQCNDTLFDDKIWPVDGQINMKWAISILPQLLLLLFVMS